jgi:carbonic anhydrase
VIDYGVGHLNATHVAIVGHTHCGGVKAAFDSPAPTATTGQGKPEHKGKGKGHEKGKGKGHGKHGDGECHRDDGGRGGREEGGGLRASCHGSRQWRSRISCAR